MTKSVNFPIYRRQAGNAAMGGTEMSDILARAADLSEDFATRAAEHDRTGSFPFENFEALRDAGLLNLTVPVEFGGQGAGLPLVCRVIELVARGDASTALVLAMHYIYHAIFARTRRWPPGVQERVCRESVEGIALINVMRVEPELGTPQRGGLPRTTAEPVSDGWRLSGHKLYATGSPILRYHIVWARTAGGDPEVGYFLVPADAHGVRIVETWDHLGMRATGSHDLLLDGVEVPYEHALDLRPATAPAPMDPAAAGWNALTLTALYHGVATAARDWLTGYLHERVPSNLGASLATLPRFQMAVGEIQALLYANERLIYGLAEDLDRGAEGTGLSQPALVKFLATNNAIRAVDIALGLIGNPGLSRSNPLERHHRDVLCSRIHTPQDDMITLTAGKAALGIK
jgi:alkylation response protein AidB-like acyl-CoA dehydrogenase